MACHWIIGCGYLGRCVASLWLARGHSVVATTRSAEKAKELQGPGVLPVVLDVLQPGGLDALPAAEVVLYCVGFDRQAGVPMRTVYVEGLANTLEALPAAAKLVYISSTGVYGQSGGEEVDETAATMPADSSGQVVLEAETLLRRRRPDAVVLRFAGIYGPGRLIRSDALRSGEPLVGDPDRWLNLIHVEDGAAACVLAAERGRPGAVYNVRDDCPVSRRQFYTMLAERLQAPPPRFVPAAAGTASREERGNRRISNRRLRQELGLELRYPTYAEGLKSI